MSGNITSLARNVVAAAGVRARSVVRRFRADSSGMAAIEMALVFPMMLAVYCGLVDVTNVLSANRRVTLVASTVGDLVTQAPGVITKADMQGFYNAVGPIMDPFPAADVGINLFAYRVNGGSAQLRWQDSRGPSCGAPSTAGLSDLMTEGNDVVVSMVCINYRPLTGNIIGSGPITLSDALTLRPRQELTIICTNC